MEKTAKKRAVLVVAFLFIFFFFYIFSQTGLVCYLTGTRERGRQGRRRAMRCRG